LPTGWLKISSNPKRPRNTFVTCYLVYICRICQGIAWLSCLHICDVLFVSFMAFIAFLSLLHHLDLICPVVFACFRIFPFTIFKFISRSVQHVESKPSCTATDEEKTGAAPTVPKPCILKLIRKWQKSNYGMSSQTHTFIFEAFWAVLQNCHLDCATKSLHLIPSHLVRPRFVAAATTQTAKQNALHGWMAMTILAKPPPVDSNDSNDQSNCGMLNLCAARDLPTIASRTYLRQSIKPMLAHTPVGHKPSKSSSMIGKRAERLERIR